MNGKIIKFLRTKDFKFIEEIGQGGTGRTVLLEDEIINEKFVCKKYSPIYDEYKKEFFNNFKDEIKLLHLVYHKNIVRVFNYYLYPEDYTGYILMEYIKGENISSFLKQNPDKLNDTFRQTIDGFVHLESSKILHRDLRPDNILISKNGIVKIIDFGFSKKIDFESDFNKSISLNWRYVPPQDFEMKIYNFRTEIYFVGKLFEEIIRENNFKNFAYKELLKSMTSFDYDKRIKSFHEIEREIISKNASEIKFTIEEKQVYQEFADSLITVFSNVYLDSEYITDISYIIKNLEDIYQNSILEDIVQNPSAVTKCFIKGNYKYYKSREIKVESLNNFLSFLKASSIERQKVVLNNLWQRFDKIERYNPNDNDELPF